MTDIFSVLLIDDEERILSQLQTGLTLSIKNHFQVEIASSLHDCITKGFVDREFNIVIVDLRFGIKGQTLELGAEVEDGFLLLLSRSEFRESEIRIVYSAYATVQNVVQAMKSGATDVVSKSDCPPHKLVEHIEEILASRTKQSENQQIINGFVVDNSASWLELKSGRVLAIAVDPDLNQAEIRAEGKSRLEALLNYHEWRQCDKRYSKFTIDPHLHQVPTNCYTETGV